MLQLQGVVENWQVERFQYNNNNKSIFACLEIPQIKSEVFSAKVGQTTTITQ